MSVPKGERGVTGKEFMKAAERLHDDIIKLLLRDFGVKRVFNEITGRLTAPTKSWRQRR